MKKLTTRGFTLIELLVVIAIIGILSSIVLASLSSARSKGEDSAILATLSNMRVQAELFYSNNNGYATTGPAYANCGTGIFVDSGVGGLKNLTTDLQKEAVASNVICYASSTLWNVAVKLKGSGYACADSSGNSVSSSTKASHYSTTTGVCTE